MRAFVLDGYGAIADHVREAEIADPVPGPDDVLIEIHAASLNPIDFKIAHGDLKRVSKYQLPRPFGFDASGVVTSVGAGASKFKPGDAVFARASRDTIGTFAEQIALGENLVALKPTTISHAEAASLPLVGLTTVQMFGRAGAKSGQRILIHAGSGGVGTFAVQYAKHLGLHVTSTTSSKNADFVASLGADRVIAYDRENYLQQDGKYEYRLRHARWRIHHRCLQGGEARRRGDLAQGSRIGFRPARRRWPAGWHRRLADGTEGLRRQRGRSGRDTNGRSPNPTATSCATLPRSSMEARSSRWSIANSLSSSCPMR
jgi:threonine dehydrogenase-like Zn-dependent dehydrogenase